MRQTARLMAVAALAAAGTALAAQPGARVLRYRFTRGQTLRYRVTMDIRARAVGQPSSSSAPGMVRTGTNELRVTKVNRDGSAVVSASQSSSISGAARPGGPRTVFTYTATPLGQMRGIRSATGAAPEMMGVMLNPDALALMQAQMPERAVRPGDTWTTTAASPFKGGKAVAVRSRLLDITDRGGAAIVRIRQVFTIPVDMTINANGQPMAIRGSVTVQGTTGFNATAGRIETAASAAKGTLQFPASGGAKDAAPTAIDLRFTMSMALMR